MSWVSSRPGGPVAPRGGARRELREPQPTAEAIRPFPLVAMSPEVARVLWEHLTRDVAGSWVASVGRLAETAPSFQEAAEAWLGGLLQLLAAPDGPQGDIARVISRLFDRAESVKEIQESYGRITAGHESVVFPRSDSGSIYSTSLIPRPDRFITRDTKIVTMGSCFAEKIGGTLAERGMNHFVTEHPPEGLDPKEALARGYHSFSARYGLLYNSPALRQMVERGFGVFQPLPAVYPCRSSRAAAGGGLAEIRWQDPYRADLTFETPEAWSASLPEFQRALRQTVEEAEVAIITVGVNEVWKFLADGSVFAKPPIGVSPGLLQRKVLSVGENVEELQRLIDVWTRRNPKLRLIFTVSPVPLIATFRPDQHVVLANCHSKAVLRAAVDEVVEANDRVSYFPAYEAVMYGTREPFEADGRHPSPGAYQRVVDLFFESFVHA